MENEKANIDMERTEKEQAEKLRGRKRRWLVLSIIFTAFAVCCIFWNVYIHFDVPFLYSVPFIIPVAICWSMYIVSRKLDTVTKKHSRIIYRIATIIVTIALFVSFEPMLVSSGHIDFNHQDNTNDIRDYEHARVAATMHRDSWCTLNFPERINDNMDVILFSYTADISWSELFFAYTVPEEDFDHEKTSAKQKEVNAIKRTSLVLDDDRREFLELFVLDNTFLWNEYQVYDGHGGYSPKEYYRFFEETDVYFFDVRLPEFQFPTYDIEKENVVDSYSFTPHTGYICGAVTREQDGLIFYFYMNLH